MFCGCILSISGFHEVFGFFSQYDGDTQVMLDFFFSFLLMSYMCIFKFGYTSQYFYIKMDEVTRCNARGVTHREHPLRIITDSAVLVSSTEVVVIET